VIWRVDRGKRRNFLTFQVSVMRLQKHVAATRSPVFSFLPYFSSSMSSIGLITSRLDKRGWWSQLSTNELYTICDPLLTGAYANRGENKFCWFPVVKAQKNKAGCIHGCQMRPPIVISSLIAPSLVTPFPAPFITSYHYPFTIRNPWWSRWSRFRAFKKQRVTDRRTVGRTDGGTDPLIKMRGRILKHWTLARCWFYEYSQ